MTDIDVRNYCLSKPGAWEDFPFDEETLVIKVGSKMFALMGEEEPLRINLKCEPLEAIMLRQKYKSIKPGYHMNKKHWNTVVNDGSLTDAMLMAMIDDSYDLVFTSLKKSEKEKIAKGNE